MRRLKIRFLPVLVVAMCSSVAAGFQGAARVYGQELRSEQVDIQIDVGEDSYRVGINARFAGLKTDQQVEFVTRVGKPTEKLLVRTLSTEQRTVAGAEVLSFTQDLPLERAKARAQSIILMPQPLLNGQLLMSPIVSFRATVSLPSGKKILSANLPGAEQRLADGGRKVTFTRDYAYVPVLTLTIIDDDPDFDATRGARDQVSPTESRFVDLVKNLGSGPVGNVVVRGFLPYVRDLEIDAGEGAAVIVTPEDVGYLYSVVIADFPARSEREVRYRFGHDAHESSFALGQARVEVDGRTVALTQTHTPLASQQVREAGLRSLGHPPQSQAVAGPTPIACSPNSCRACRAKPGCNRHSPDCRWDDQSNVCLPSCGQLGGSCQSSAGGTRICLQDKGRTWDCELCCADPTTTLNCLRPDAWGNSGGARFLNEHNPAQCQPGNACDMNVINAGNCWLKLQACWALLDWQNAAGKPISAFTQDDHVLAVLKYVEQNMDYRVDKQNEACLCPRIGWCFGDSQVWCPDYLVSWAWFWDWGCDYPVAAKLVSETGVEARDGACGYCPGKRYCGDCEDFAHLRAGLLRSNGFHSDCVWVARGPNHVFNHVVYGGAYRIADYGSTPRSYSHQTETHHWANGLFNDHHGGFFSDPHSGTKEPRDFTWNYPRFYNGVSQKKTCTVPFHRLHAYLADLQYCP